MPESLLIWIVLASFAFGVLCGLITAYVRGLMHRKMFTFLPLNRHVRVLRRRKRASKPALMQNLQPKAEQHENPHP
ncbi:hypothetical protein CWE08_09460 [Aliidiomarina iranensis]|uniref:Uncharacterized protein n=1 Tax=Aliidiomarina iranensis TaxID=1434071 RepID=A0A432VT91_9GAMM|nr:hypothetical protein [Aliidiomarina iranensis]RUO19648.1 hypothetical protein CWE08_09460 [Aliidiomarina iranensis]